MTAPGTARVRGQLPSGPSPGHRAWQDQLPAGKYIGGRSDPLLWPPGIRRVPAAVTRADITAGDRDKAGRHPVALAVARALRLPPAAEVKVCCPAGGFEIRLGQVAEWHELPREGIAFAQAWSRRRPGQCRPFTFTIITAEDWGAGEEQA